MVVQASHSIASPVVLPSEHLFPEIFLLVATRNTILVSKYHNGAYFYVATSDGLSIYDLNLTLVQNFNTTAVLSLDEVEKYLYVGFRDQLIQFDVTDITKIQMIANFTFPSN